MQIGVGSSASNDTGGATFITYRMLAALRRDLTSFSEISGWDSDAALMKDSEGSLRTYPAGLVTGNAFQVISLRPYLGRLIAPFDDVRGGPPNGWPVVLSYSFWQEHYGKDIQIVGKQITIADTQLTVVGVAPPEFRGVWPGTDIKMYFPMQFANVLAKRDVLNLPDSLYGCSAIGRIKPNVSVATANAEISRLRESLFAQFIPAKFQHDPFFEKAYMRVNSARSGLPTYITHTYAKPLYLMQGLVGVVLLLCCVNVGGLMLSKVYSRQREFAVRTALGARVWRLIRQYLTESLVIALAGSALGALLAWRGCDVLLHFFRDPMMGEEMSVHPDRSMLFAAGCLAVLTTLCFGTLPAWRAGHADPGELLKSRTSLAWKRHTAGRAFVPIQVAISLVLVVFASLLSQSIVKLRGERTGFDTDHVTIQTSPLYLLKLNGEAKLTMYQQMVDRLGAMPDVRSAAVTFQTPMTGVKITSRFQAMGDGTTCRVLGLAEDAKFFDVRQGPPRTIYFPLSMQRVDNYGALVFLINSGTKATAISAFRKVLSETAPSVPLVLFVTLREQMDAALGSQELITLLSNFFGILALLLSALGLYGLLSASVVQRTGEIGMRVALGADRRQVIRMILGEALQMLGWGMLLGIVILIFTTRFASAMLYGVSAFDPLTLIAVVPLLTGVTVIAALVPALRAATVDPMVAPRAE
jgi:ABC-type antimicrobial peptide transport system permease subunit